MKKRVFALFSVVCLVFTCFPLTAFAATGKNEIPLAEVSGQAKITRHSPESSGERSSWGNSANPLNFAEDTSVSYTYLLTYYEDDTSKVGVDLDFTVGEGAETYSFSANGDVPRMELNNSVTMLRGPLYGTFVANGSEYSFSASFTKLEGSDEINIGLVITSNDFKYQKMYSFGSFVMTDAIHNAWTNYKSQRKNTSSDTQRTNTAPVSSYANDNYVYVGSDYGAIGDTNQTSLTGDGNRIDGFVDNEHKRIMLTLSSYCDRFNSSSFTNGTFVSAYIQDFEIGLQQRSTPCYISGIREVNLPADGGRADLDFVFSTADTLLGLLPPPYNAGASIILSLLQLSDPATFNHIDYDDHQRIEVDGGTWSEITLDDAPLPVVFQIANSATTLKSFTGTGYGSLTYVADVYVTVFYIPTERAELYISVTNVS